MASFKRVVAAEQEIDLHSYLFFVYCNNLKKHLIILIYSYNRYLGNTLIHTVYSAYVKSNAKSIKSKLQ